MFDASPDKISWGYVLIFPKSSYLYPQISRTEIELKLYYTEDSDPEKICTITYPALVRHSYDDPKVHTLLFLLMQRLKFIICPTLQNPAK
jgi:hypothetical protein